MPVDTVGTVRGARWVLAVLGGALAIAVAVAVIAVVGEERGRVIAIDAATGDERWTMRSSDGNVEVVFGTDELVYANHRGCFLLDLSEPSDVAVMAIDSRRGRVRWRADGVLVGGDLEGAYEIRDQLQRSPGAVLPVMTVGYADRELVGVDRETGATRWRAPAARTVTAAVSQDVVVVRLTGDQMPPAHGQLSAFDRSNGRALWSRDYRADQFPRATGSGTSIAILSRVDDDHALLELLEGTTGSTRFARGLPGWFAQGQVGFAGETVLVSGGTELRALDRSTGETRWTITASTGITPPPVIGDVAFTQLGPDATIGAIDVASGALRWSFPPADARFSLPITTRDIVATGWSSDGRSRLTGVAAATGEARWERVWPHGGHDVAGAPDTVYLSGGCALTSRT